LSAEALTPIQGIVCTIALAILVLICGWYLDTQEEQA